VTIAVGASTKIDRVEVVNAAGSLVLVRNGESAAASSMNIDLSSLASGVYTATVFSSGHRTSTMLVITR
ncbi:MAG: T9SS type A sorting domain-containing protein, partial [Ignavibacteria bacterium]